MASISELFEENMLPLQAFYQEIHLLCPNVSSSPSLETQTLNKVSARDEQHVAT